MWSWCGELRMTAREWFWLVFSCVVLLAVLGRILRSRTWKHFFALQTILNKMASYVGWLLLATFLPSMTYAFLIGFPE